MNKKPAKWKPLGLPSKSQSLQLPPSAEPKPVQPTRPFSRKLFEPIISRSITLDKLATEVVLHAFDIDCTHDIQTCYGDIYKIVNALMDYAKMLEEVCDEWGLQGYHRAVYELHAENLRAVAKKYQESIGYDYDAALARCEAKKKRQHKDNDIGGDGLEMAVKRGQLNSKKSQAEKKEY